MQGHKIIADPDAALAGVRRAVGQAVDAGVDVTAVRATVDTAYSVGPVAPRSLEAVLCDALSVGSEKADALAAAVRATIAGALREESMRRAQVNLAAAAAYKEEPDDTAREVRHQLDVAERQRRREDNLRADAEEEERQHSTPWYGYFAPFTARRD